MSGYSCRDTYFNYGSYLRSRGYDQEICNLVTAIENGQIPYGAITSHPGEGATIDGTLVVKQAGGSVPTVDMTKGQLFNYGGSLGQPLGAAVQPSALGAQLYKGLHLFGPIYQTANLSHVGTGSSGYTNSNVFRSQEHIFTTFNDISSTKVIIKGDLIVDGSSVTFGEEYTDMLTIESLSTHDNEMLVIYHGARDASNLDIMDVWLDSSDNVLAAEPGAYEKLLAFSIDGILDTGATIGTNGSTDVPGRLRMLRGATVTSAPAPTGFDISYATVDISNLALDLYGGVRLQAGPNSSDAVFSISGETGLIAIGANGVNNASIDASGLGVFYELSAHIMRADDLSLGTLDATNIYSHFLDVSASSAAPIASFQNLGTGAAVLVGQGHLDMSANSIQDVSYITFSDGTSFFHGNSFDISSSENIVFTSPAYMFTSGDVAVGSGMSVVGDLSAGTLFSSGSLSAVGGLDVSGSSILYQSVVMNDSLTVLSDLSAGTLFSSGGLSAVGGLDVSGSSVLYGGVAVNNTLTVTGDLHAANVLSNGALSAAGNLDVSGSAVLYGDLSLSNKPILDVSYITFSDGTSFFHGNSFDISSTEAFVFTSPGFSFTGGDASFTGNVVIDGTISSNASYVSFADVSCTSIEVHGPLDVCGNNTSRFGGNIELAIGKKLMGDVTGDVTGTVSTLSNFAVQDVSFAKLFLTNDASFNGSLAVGGEIAGDVTGTVSSLSNFATQDVSFASLFLSNDASFNGNLAVGGTITGDVTGNVTGTVSSLSNFAVQDVSFASLFLSNDASFNGMLGVGGDCSVSGILRANDASFNGSLAVGGGITGDVTGTVSTLSNFATQDVSFASLYLSNDASFDGTLTVGGDASFNGLVKVHNHDLEVVGGSLFVIGTGSHEFRVGHLATTKFLVDAATGNTDVGGSLTVAEDVSFNTNFYVVGDSSFNGHMYAHDASFSGNVYFPHMPSGTTFHTVKWDSVDGKLHRDTSSLRYKTNIVDMPREFGEMMYSLRPRIYKRPDGDREEIGLIAEEVDEVGLKHVVIYDAEGRPDALAYDRLVAPLIQVVKDQKERIDALEARVAALEQPR